MLLVLLAYSWDRLPMSTRHVAFIESNYQSASTDIAGFEVYTLGTENAIDMIILDDLHNDLVLIFAGGTLAKLLAKQYGGRYVPPLEPSPSRQIESLPTVAKS